MELICGCMFSGKSELLLARLRAARARGRTAAVFKNALDDRYASGEIVTHGGLRRAAIAVAAAADIPPLAGDAHLVVIDEAQFFGAGLPEICIHLIDRGQDVVVAGLDLDSWGLPFGPMPELERIADVVTRVTARCTCCGDIAVHTQRLTPVEDPCMVGGAESYEPRCRDCFRPPPIELRR